MAKQTAANLLSQPGFRFVITAKFKREKGRVPTPAELRAEAERIAAKVA